MLLRTRSSIFSATFPACNKSGQIVILNSMMPIRIPIRLMGGNVIKRFIAMFAAKQRAYCMHNGRLAYYPLTLLL